MQCWEPQAVRLHGWEGGENKGIDAVFSHRQGGGVQKNGLLILRYAYIQQPSRFAHHVLNPPLSCLRLRHFPPGSATLGGKGKYNLPHDYLTMAEKGKSHFMNKKQGHFII